MAFPTQARAPWAALFSALLPGLGHAYVGESRRAYFLFVIDFLLFASVSVAIASLGSGLIRAWVTPRFLIGLMAFNVAILVYRAFAMAGAYTAAPRDGTGVWSGMGMFIALALLVVPHLVVGYYSWSTYDMIRWVFAAPVDTTTTTSTLPPPTTTTTTLPPPTTAPIVVVPVDSSTTTTTSTTLPPPPTTTTTIPTVWDGLNRLNILLLGSDAGKGRVGTRFDTNIVVSIDPVTGDAVMVSLPRNLSNAPLPPGMGIWDCNCFPDLLGHLHTAAVRNPEAFPGPNEPGFNAIRGAVGEILGIPIHYHAMVTLGGFMEVIDAFGGVTIDIPKTVTDPLYPPKPGAPGGLEFKKGTHHLNGYQALAYARIRSTTDDFDRMHRQRCILSAMVEQTSAAEMILNFPRLAGVLKENLITDIPQDRLVDFIDLIPRVSTDRVTALRIDRSYQIGTEPGRSYYDLERIRTEVAAALGGAGSEDVDLGPALAGACDK